jgi:YaiO family outer membrane protein
VFRGLTNGSILLGVLACGVSAAHAQVGTPAQADEEYRAGRFAQAAATLTGLLAAHPNDADLLRRMAAVEAAEGHLPEANRTIDRAQQIAPADHDIQLARANILLWRGQMLAAKAQADALSIEDPHYPGLEQFNADLTAKRRDEQPRLVLASLTLSDANVTFPGGRNSETWKDQTAALGYALSSSTTIVGEEEVDARAKTDVRLSGQISHRFEDGTLYVGAAGTPHAFFREKWSITGGGEMPINGQWDLLADVRYAEYRTSTVGVIQPALRFRPISGLTVTGQMINLFGGGKDYRLGGSLRFEYAMPHLAGLYTMLASYPDTESDGTRQLRSVTAGATMPIHKNWEVRLSGDYEKRENSYEERQVTVGLQWHFAR